MAADLQGPRNGDTSGFLLIRPVRDWKWSEMFLISILLKKQVNNKTPKYIVASVFSH